MWTLAETESIGPCPSGAGWKRVPWVYKCRAGDRGFHLVTDKDLAQSNGCWYRLHIPWKNPGGATEFIRMDGSVWAGPCNKQILAENLQSGLCDCNLSSRSFGRRSKR